MTLAPAYPILDGLYYAAAAAYVVAWILRLFAPRAARTLLGVGVVLHLAGSLWRAWIIGFLPLTNKFESFSALALCIAIVALITWGPRRLYDLVLLGVGIAAEDLEAIAVRQRDIADDDVEEPVAR